MKIISLYHSHANKQHILSTIKKFQLLYFIYIKCYRNKIETYETSW